MALADLHVRNAKATGKNYTLGDYDGLSLFVSPKDSNAWHFRYHWLGKPSRMSLGMYPELGLRDARAMRDKARKLIAKGINPRIARKRASKRTHADCHKAAVGCGNWCWAEWCLYEVRRS